MSLRLASNYGEGFRHLGDKAMAGFAPVIVVLFPVYRALRSNDGNKQQSRIKIWLGTGGICTHRIELLQSSALLLGHGAKVLCGTDDDPYHLPTVP